MSDELEELQKPRYKHTFHSERRKVKVKVKEKAKARAKTLFAPTHLSLEDRRRRTERTESEKLNVVLVVEKDIGRMIASGAMSPSSSSSQNRTRTARMTTQQHLSSQAKKVTMCFILNDYSDDPDTSVYMVGQNPCTWLVKTYLFRLSQLDRHF